MMANHPLALRVAIAATLAEILLVIIVTLRAGPADASLAAGLLWATLKVTPLLVLLPSMLRGSGRATTWLCFLLCGYFVAAVMAAVSPPPMRWLALLEIAVIAVGFTAGLLATRWSRQQPAQATGAETPRS